MSNARDHAIAAFVKCVKAEWPAVTEQGYIETYDSLICDDCQGKGKVKREVYEGGFVMNYEITCFTCNGKGWKDE